MAAGETRTSILASYPYLEAADIDAALSSFRTSQSNTSP
jgi:uncharacterized protein (DUF433 family)